MCDSRWKWIFQLLRYEHRAVFRSSTNTASIVQMLLLFQGAEQIRFYVLAPQHALFPSFFARIVLAFRAIAIRVCQKQKINQLL
jgi:hypothetical protein